MDMGLGWGRRSIDVGVDNLVKSSVTGSFCPLHEDEIHELFYHAAGHDDPSYYPNNKGMSELDT